MRMCSIHKRPLEGRCQWCGQDLCKSCIGKSLGGKLYCEECSEDVGHIVEKRQRQIIANEEEKQAREEEVRRFLRR